jgi:hypothetical protein
VQQKRVARIKNFGDATSISALLSERREPVIIEAAIIDKCEKCLNLCVACADCVRMHTRRWGAVKWSFESLRSKIGSREATVAFFSPNADDKHEIAWETRRSSGC